MRRWVYVSLISTSLFVCFVPGFVFAAVRINEVAWMGTAANSYAEWIELFNTDTNPVSLSGWSFSIASSSTPFPLTGSIDGLGYYLLEHNTSGTRALDTSNQTYTGNISNAGTILTLFDASRNAEDTLDASGGWQAGDNTTKETAQYLEKCNEWTTAEPTPGGATVDTCPKTATPAAVAPTLPSIHVDIGSDRTLSTHDVLEDDAVVYDDDANILTDGSISWAFGDGGRDSGHHPSHTYEYPGAYVVDVRVHRNYQKAEASFVVTVDDADIGVSENSTRGVGLTNTDERILDLSHWRVRADDTSYELPVGTLILPGHTVIIPADISKLHTPAKALVLEYPSGEVAAAFTASILAKPNVAQ